MSGEDCLLHFPWWKIHLGNKHYLYPGIVLDIAQKGLRTSGSSESVILIFGRVLACAGSGVNKVTDIKSEFSRMNRDISVRSVLTLCSSSEILPPEAHTVISSA